MDHPTEEPAVRPDGGSTARSVSLVASGLGLIVLIALAGPRVGPIGVGTLIALGVAVWATRTALQGNRETRL